MAVEPADGDRHLPAQPAPDDALVGAGLTFVYNDAYAPMLGKRHPDALGRSGRDVWADIWPQLRPQVEAVMSRGEATWNERVHLVMERNGVPEDTWFTWAYGPVPDDHGGVGGLLNVCRDDTANVLAERERDRLHRAFATERSNLASIVEQAPAFICTLRGPDHRFELVNGRYYDLIGRREVVGRAIREALPELEGQGFFELLDRVYRTGEPSAGSEVPIDLRSAADGTLSRRFVDFA